MPDKYEREIDEILRRSDDRYWRRRAGTRRSMSPPPLSFPEKCLVIAILAALIGGGWAYANGGNLLTGIFGLIGTVCIALVALSSFIKRDDRPSSSRWR